MSKVPGLLVPLTLGFLLPAASSAAATVATQSTARPRLDVEVSATTLERGDAGAHADAPATYGEQLIAMAHRAAERAATQQGGDLSMEAISDLAARWLVTPEGATRVWDRTPNNPHSVRKAIHNQARSLVRRERRHERIARDAPCNDQVAPSQPAAIELDELVRGLDVGDRELLGYSAQGMNAREIADHLGISHAAARQRLARARRHLRQ